MKLRTLIVYPSNHCWRWRLLGKNRSDKLANGGESYRNRVTLLWMCVAILRPPVNVIIYGRSTRPAATAARHLASADGAVSFVDDRQRVLGMVKRGRH